jgi:hypothetical protein
MTLTSMVEGIKDNWIVVGLPTNTPADILNMIAYIAGTGNIAGRAVYIEGRNRWEIEQGLDETQQIWLGKIPSEQLNRSVKTLGSVCFLTPLMPRHILSTEGSNWDNHSNIKDPILNGH